MTRPVLLVIAGPNGAGKTTVTVRLRDDHWSHGVEYLNPDDVAQTRFGDWNSPRASLEAAEWTTARREKLLRQQAGIAFETVFSTPEKVDFLQRAKSSGYFVRVFFIGTEDPRINAARVAGRVMQGGHTVPIEKIISRYGKSMANLSAAIRLADRVYIYDNSVDGVDARLCARTEDGKLRKIYGALPPWVADAVQGLERHPAFVDLRAA
ncbi:MAG: zeta toxin family protein [Myxococcales bacterium]|nr:zeta toxin family protein [Myxococcales bacterium]